MSERGLRSFAGDGFVLERLVAAKSRTGERVSVCLPARDEQATVGSVVSTLRSELVDGARRDHGRALVDEVVVVDDHSSDDTAAVAAEAGATVVDAASLLVEHGPGHGKGAALWKSLYASSGDLVVWIDADIVDFDAGFALGLLGPLLSEPAISFVKGHYHRPEGDGVGGGRVTELLARPLLSQFFPELAEVAQPLGGEYAGRRSLLQRLAFVVGYGVDVALLIDAYHLAGITALAQVDLGVRQHRNRSLEELGPQALAVSQTILDRAGVRPPGSAVLRRPGRAPLTVPFEQRPPVATLTGPAAVDRTGR